MLDTKMLLEALDAIEEKGVSREIAIQSLKEAFESIYKKKNYEDVRVQVDILPELGQINMYTIRKVVEEVNDDALEIELDEAKEINPDIKVGEDLYEKVNIDEISKQAVKNLSSILKTKIKEAEKAAIMSIYSDKQGELISGTVEKVDQNSTSINIGRVVVILPNKHKIGDEKFEVGQTVKVHLSEISAGTGGPQLHVSRADCGFLKRLFEEEIHEIYSGTVEIVEVAREAGERSKVSVRTNDENVDPIGACIGPAGSKIKKICDQIGKEKIDIVQYHELPGLFIAEALKPAVVIGVAVSEETKSAVAIVKDGDLRVAIGKKGINVLLAVKLTGWKIDIKEATTALENGIIYTSIEELQRQEEQLKAEKRREALVKQAQEEAAKAAEEPVEVEETVETVEEVATPAEEVKEETPVVEEVVVEEVKEKAKPEVKFEEEKVELKPVYMQSKISLDEIEKQIEDEKKRNKIQPKARKSYKKEEEVEEKKPIEEEKVDRNNYMNVEYTEEELEEIENQEAEDAPSYDDDVDYDEYDHYYDD